MSEANDEIKGLAARWIGLRDDEKDRLLAWVRDRMAAYRKRAIEDAPVHRPDDWEALLSEDIEQDVREALGIRSAWSLCRATGFWQMPDAQAAAEILRREAVAWKHWSWSPGCQSRSKPSKAFPDGRVELVTHVEDGDPCAGEHDSARGIFDALPDLDDPATQGWCIELIARRNEHRSKVHALTAIAGRPSRDHS